MPNEPWITRRRLLQVGLGTAVGLAAYQLTGLRLSRREHTTPQQIRGPFYPSHDREDEDTDLTQVKGRPGTAAGEVVYVRGRILDKNSLPIEGALVEIWQANKWGRYDHERDVSNPAPLDPNFQGWGEILTDADGRYAFKTIKPGSYPADGEDWIRPPHIHFKISSRRYPELITQIYFVGEPLNEPDRIRRALSSEEQRLVTVSFEPTPSELEAGARLGVFDIFLGG